MATNRDPFEPEAEEPPIDALADTNPIRTKQIDKRTGQYTPSPRKVNATQGFVLVGNQHAQMGELVHMWADLIEGAGEQAEGFVEQLLSSLSTRQIENARLRWDHLNASGFLVPSRQMLFCKRRPVTVAIYIARQGRDLYVSWRAFVQGKFAWSKALLAVAVSVLVTYFMTFGFTLSGDPLLLIQYRFIDIVLVFVVIVVLSALFGVFFRYGDAEALWRGRIQELHYDDIVSLTLAVHNSILQAADQVGIDTTKLEKWGPFYAPQNRRRI